jgi:hypothetical protein
VLFRDNLKLKTTMALGEARSNAGKIKRGLVI